MIYYSKPGETFTALLSGAPEGLEGTIGVRVEASDETIVTARTTAGISEIVTGTYIKPDMVAPTGNGEYIIIWDDGAVTPSGYGVDQLLVIPQPPGSPATPLDIDWAPDLATLGSLMRARTTDTFGGYLGTFTTATRPTADEAQLILNMAVASIAAKVGSSPCNDVLAERAKGLATLYAAMLIEAGYFPEQMATDQSPYRAWKSMYDEDFPLLVAEVNEQCGGVDAGGDFTQEISFWFGDKLGVGIDTEW